MNAVVTPGRYPQLPLLESNRVSNAAGVTCPGTELAPACAGSLQCLTTPTDDPATSSEGPRGLSEGLVAFTGALAEGRL